MIDYYYDLMILHYDINIAYVSPPEECTCKATIYGIVNREHHSGWFRGGLMDGLKSGYSRLPPNPSPSRSILPPNP